VEREIRFLSAGEKKMGKLNLSSMVHHTFPSEKH
jgi:hypothetical protein